MRKNFVLDTNVLVHTAGAALAKFQENNIWIPSIVLEELDHLTKKKDNPETAYSARQAVKALLEYQKKGNLFQGVPTDGGGKIVVFVAEEKGILPDGWDQKKNDNLILESVLAVKKKHNGVILVTNDGVMTLKAVALKIDVQEYRNDRVDLDTLYTGRLTVPVTEPELDRFAKEKELDLQTVSKAVLKAQKGEKQKEENRLYSGQYINLVTNQGGSMLGKIEKDKFVPLHHLDDPFFDIKPRNQGQTYFKEALMEGSDTAPLVIGLGPAGTGKTLLALAAGLEQTYNQQKYSQVLLCRANVMMGGEQEKIGFLPGDEREKIAPLFRPVLDSMKILFPHAKGFSGDNQEKDQLSSEKILEELLDRGVLDMQAIGYIRGRSISNTFLILDETQNCTPPELTTIITRMGENSKIVIIGDPDQIDNPRLDKRNNGLVYTVDKMKDSLLSRIVMFKDDECRRSALSKEAAKKMV